MTNNTSIRTAVLTVGVPACGKSTWAAQSGLFEVNLDHCRYLACGDAADQSATQQAVLIRDALIEHAAECGYDLVISDTNINPVFRDKLVARLEELGYRVELKFFDTPFRECLRRNALRDRKVPIAVMAKMQLQLLNQL